MAEIKMHQQIQEKDIIPLNRNCHSMSELFSESMKVDGTAGFLPNKEDPPQVRELRDLQGVEPESISVEYLSWKQTYFMMIKYAKKNEDGQVEQHLKILNFNHNFNTIVYKEKQKQKKRLVKEDKDAKEGDEDAAEELDEKTKIGKCVFETKLHTYSGKKEGSLNNSSKPVSGTTMSHNNLTMKYG